MLSHLENAVVSMIFYYSLLNINNITHLFSSVVGTNCYIQQKGRTFAWQKLKGKLAL